MFKKILNWLFPASKKVAKLEIGGSNILAFSNRDDASSHKETFSHMSCDIWGPYEWFTRDRYFRIWVLSEKPAEELEETLFKHTGSRLIPYV